MRSGLWIVVLVVVASAAGAPPAPGPAPLPAVFGRERPAGGDLLLLRGGEVLRGTVLDESFTVHAPWGAVTVPAGRCAGLSFERAAENRETLVTVDRNRITGILASRAIRLRLELDGSEAAVRKEDLLCAVFRRRPEELSFLQPGAARDVFVMRNGDLLTGRAREMSFPLATDRGVVRLSFGDVETVEVEAGRGGATVVRTRKGDVLAGVPANPELSLRLDCGAEVPAVRIAALASIHVDHVPPEHADALGAPGAAGTGAITRVEVAPDLGFDLVRIAPGEFTMGSPVGEPGRGDDERPHRVRITKPFLLAATETTQALWLHVMGDNPSVSRGTEKPVTNVSWDACQEFLGRLNEKIPGRHFRLPTEAEWEYACRAGGTGAFCCGDDEAALGEYAWYGANSQSQSHPVGQKKPDAFGLFDMHGNVWEWVADFYGGYELPATGAVVDPTGPATGGEKAMRGGSYEYSAPACRSAVRNRYGPAAAWNVLGFRIAASPVD